MNNFLVIFKHYTKRSWMDIIGPLMFTLMPLGIIIFNIVASEENMENGYNLAATGASAVMLIAFQFFCGQILLHYFMKDFRGDMRFRLQAAPVSGTSFIVGAVLASWVFSVIQGLIIIIVTALFFNVYWGNPLITALIFLIVSIMSQLLAALTALLSNKYSTATAISFIYCFGFMILSGVMIGSLGDNALMNFLETRGTPLSLAWRGIHYSGFILDDMNQAWINISILAIMTVVLAVAVFIVAKRRRSV
ncbi:MAG: ABC transporter permease [Defluviitaleaceae bacterium]|nr:ABC transporter permease [Defluviitaleaceae bacterium]